MGVPAQDLDLKQALAHFGLKGREHVPLGILSQGQKRRVALAKLKLARAPLWVLDEPLVALDSHTVDLFTQLLEQHLNSAGLVILTSHQPIQLSGLGRVLMLSK
jgi:heme exporter protein A